MIGDGMSDVIENFARITSRMSTGQLALFAVLVMAVLIAAVLSPDS